MTNDSIRFEEAMTKLEKVVNQLEAGDVPLEDAINLYKEGMELSSICQNKLQDAEKQLMSMIDEKGEIETIDLQKGEGENEQ